MYNCKRISGKHYHILGSWGRGAGSGYQSWMAGSDISNRTKINTNLFKIFWSVYLKLYL